MASLDQNLKPVGEKAGTVTDKSIAAAESESNEGIGIQELGASIYRGRRQTLGLGLLGLVAGTLAYLAISPFLPVTTSTRLVFAFPGLEKGEYPDHSKFQADDLRAPENILQALKRQGLDVSEESQGKVRGALSIEGIVSANLVKERDRLRASGQTPPLFIPDEYIVSLTLPRKFSLSTHRREMLLNDIVNVYLQNFQETYSEIPVSFGNAFETLKRADYYEYEVVLNQDIQNIKAYLSQQLEKAPSFRSPTTHLSFADLLEQVNLFSQLQLNEALGLIYKNGLSANRDTAMLKMDYYLRTLEDEGNKAIAEDHVISDLLAQTQLREQNYVLGIKSQAAEPRTQAPILDQGLIDSLLVNDAYNFLVHRAVDAGMKVQAIEAEKATLLGRRKTMESFLKNAPEDQSELRKQVQESMASLERDYGELAANIRRTNSDFGRQQYGNAVRFADEIRTDNITSSLAIFGFMGALAGLASGVGLSLLGLNLAFQRSR